MYQNNTNGLKFRHCSEAVMTQSHCISCPGMAERRGGLELIDINDITFRRILKVRDKKYDEGLLVCYMICIDAITPKITDTSVDIDHILTFVVWCGGWQGDGNWYLFLIVDFLYKIMN